MQSAPPAGGDRHEGRSADDPGQRLQADHDKRWRLGGRVMEQTANFDRGRIPCGCIRRQSCSSPLARSAGHSQHLAFDGRCPSDPLGTLNDKGIIIRRVQPAGSASRDEHRVGDNLQHLIRRTCSRMANSTVRSGDTPARDGRRRLGLCERQSRESSSRADVPNVSRQLPSRPTAQSGPTACDRS